MNRFQTELDQAQPISTPQNFEAARFAPFSISKIRFQRRGGLDDVARFLDETCVVFRGTEKIPPRRTAAVEFHWKI
jgi:hypothetical protein